jgi:alpha-glucoside transport system substrate-binding protein
MSAVLVTVGLGACTGADAGSVTVLASWTGAEEQAFRQVLDGFTAHTGIHYDYHGTRALSQVLVSDVQKGSPPDVAVLPNLGELANYVRRDALHPLDDVIGQSQESSHSPQWLELEKAGTPHRYAVAVKADLKSLIWYDPKRLPDLRTRPPQTWDQLIAVSKALGGTGRVPWCMGMGATPTSGWPGTDWIEDIVLHQQGGDFYRRWAGGNVDWRSAEIRQAWTTWGTIAVEPGMVHGGPSAALLTDFGDAGRPMFNDPPGCLLHHQASFIMGIYPGYRVNDGPPPQVGTDVDFVPFPDFHAPATDTASQKWEVSADLAGMFSDKPQARKLISYLATDEAQSIWPKVSNGAVFSANRNVNADVYDNGVSKRIARILTSQATLCFDASDLMPTAMTNAFNRAVLEYLHDPGQLNGLLAQLDQIRRAVNHEEWLNVRCGPP